MRRLQPSFVLVLCTLLTLTLACVSDTVDDDKASKEFTVEGGLSEILNTMCKAVKHTMISISDEISDPESVTRCTARTAINAAVNQLKNPDSALHTGTRRVWEQLSSPDSTLKRAMRGAISLSKQQISDPESGLNYGLKAAGDVLQRGIDRLVDADEEL